MTDIQHRILSLWNDGFASGRGVGVAQIEAFIIAEVAAERERCAKIADECSARVKQERPEVVEVLNGQMCLTYTMGYAIASERIAARIRSGG